MYNICRCYRRRENNMFLRQSIWSTQYPQNIEGYSSFRIWKCENFKLASLARIFKDFLHFSVLSVYIMSIIAPYHKLLKETALIVCMQMYLESWKYMFEALARFARSRNISTWFILSVHLGVLPPQYQQAGYATATTTTTTTTTTTSSTSSIWLAFAVVLISDILRLFTRFMINYLASSSVLV